MNQRYILSFLFLFLILSGIAPSTFAQKETTKMNQDVEVVKAYRPSVANAEKINLLPEINDTTRFRPDLNYMTISHPVTTGFKSSNLNAYNQVRKEINYPGYGKISGGFGTYLTPFLDFYLSNPNSQNGTLGLQLNHISSQGNVTLSGGEKTEAPFSQSKALIFGSYVYEGVTISADLFYQRDLNRFYGYPVAIPTNIASNDFVKYFGKDQLNQLGYLDLDVKSNASSASALKFNTGIRLGNFTTSTDQTEKEISIRGDFDYNFGTFNGKLNAGFNHFETGKVTEFPEMQTYNTMKSNWLQLSPTICFKNDFFTIEGGVNLQSVSSNTNGSSFKLYPKASFQFHTEDNKFALYAGLDGYLQNNSYSKIAEENRWINPFLSVEPTNHSNIFSGGIKGKIATPLAFDLGVKYSKTDNQYFFATRIENKSGKATPSLSDLTYDNAFEVFYDQLNTLDFSGDLTYTTPSIFLLVSGHFFNYELATLEKVPYRPDFTLQVGSEFKITNQVSASAEIFLTGPRNLQLKYFLPIWSSSLPPAPIYLTTDAQTEVNLGAKYQFTKKLAFFGRVENLLDSREEQWYGYAVQGIRFKVGGSFSF